MNRYYFKIVRCWLLFFLLSDIVEARADSRSGIRLSSYTLAQQSVVVGTGASVDFIWSPSIQKSLELSFSQENFIQSEDVTFESSQVVGRYAWSYTTWLQMAVGLSHRNIYLESSGVDHEEQARLSLLGLNTLMRSEIKLAKHVAVGVTWFEFMTPMHTKILESKYSGPRVARNAHAYVDRSLKKPATTSVLLALAPTVTVIF